VTAVSLLHLDPQSYTPSGLHHPNRTFRETNCYVDLIIASLHRSRGDVPFAQSFHFPAGRMAHKVPITGMGIAAESRVLSDGVIDVLLRSQRFAWGTRVTASGFRPCDAYFGVEPGGRRNLRLMPIRARQSASEAIGTAVNADGHLPIAIGRST
jgi:hypothetical protein